MEPLKPLHFFDIDLCLSPNRADLSARGLDKSHGLMVNYKYELEEVAERNRAYLAGHRITVSEEVEHLLQYSFMSE
jgi:hypothetical protein